MGRGYGLSGNIFFMRFSRGIDSLVPKRNGFNVDRNVLIYCFKNKDSW